MMTNLSPPQIRATTGLELAAGVFTKCSDQLASQLSVSLTSGKRDAKQTLLRIGINGDIYGGMRAPLEVGTRRVDVAYVNPASLVAMVRSFSYIHGTRPSSCRRLGALDESSTRTTIFWPCTEGVRLTR